MEILIFGGSFDPPHRGHVELLREAIRYRRPGLVYLIPAFHTPLKGPPAAPASDRLRMIQLALRELPSTFRARVRVDASELRGGRRAYTYETLERLRARHPKDALYLLLGSDCLRSFRRWRRWQTILRQAKLAVGKRSGFVTGIDGAGLRVEWLRGLFPSISSTEVRRRVAEGAWPDDEAPESVLRHVDRRGLYGRDVHHWLKSRLSPERYAHTLAVAKLAQELAGAWRLDHDAARTAALLHDAGRSMRPDALTAYVRRHRVRVPHAAETVKHSPILLHPYVSAHIARSRFGVTDNGVLRAIAHHTLGATGMGPLEKVLYVADVASEDRGFPEAGAVRKLAFEDLDAALREATRVKLAYVIASGFWVHPTGVRFWNEILNSN